MAYVDKYNRSIEEIVEDIAAAQKAFNFVKGRFEFAPKDNQDEVNFIFDYLEDKSFVKGDICEDIIDGLQRADELSEANAKILRRLVELQTQIALDKKTLRQEKEHLGL